MVRFRKLLTAAQNENSSTSRKLHIESLEDRRMLAVFSVGNANDSGSGSLRQAILDANNSFGEDSINFDETFFSSPQTLALASSLPTITEPVTINGPGSKLLTLDAGHGADNLPGTGDGFRLLDIGDANSGSFFNLTVSGLTLTGGDINGSGGAINSSENLTLNDTAIVDNATGPGAPGQNGGDGGRGGDGGGIFSSGGSLTIVRSSISGNSTGNGGAGARGNDVPPVNVGGPTYGGDGGNGGNGGYGGGIFFDGGDLVITDSTISGNSTGDGGAAGDGGDADYYGGFSTISYGGDGGDGGYGGSGGGIYSLIDQVTDRITITGSTLSGNRTGQGQDGGNGGQGMLFFETAGDGGDGGNGGSGGGIYGVQGPMEISSSTLTGNQASSSGLGGLGMSNGSPGIDGSGGGINSLGNDPVILSNTLIAQNIATGQAPDLRTGTVTLTINHCLIGNGDGLQITSGTGNQIGTQQNPINPLLGPLTHNGGSTATHPLLPSSPAIDTGDPSVLPDSGEFDQRGAPFLRVEDGDLSAGTFLDIGAYEAQAPSTADFDQDGDVDGADFLTWQRGYGQTNGALLSDGNSDDDADVDGSDLAVWEITFASATPALQAQVDQTPSSQPVLLDLALSTFAASQDDFLFEEQNLQTSVPAPTVNKVADKIEPNSLNSATNDSSQPVAPTADDPGEIDPQLHDELISRLF